MAGTICPIPAAARLDALGVPGCAAPAAAAPGFAGILNDLVAGNTQANASANAALADLATGKAQDLHTVSLAVAQADLSFRFILELRNRLSDAFQEVTRMQV